MGGGSAPRGLFRRPEEILHGQKLKESWRPPGEEKRRGAALLSILNSKRDVAAYELEVPHEPARSCESPVPDYDFAGVVAIDVEAVTPRAGHFQRCGSFEGDVSPSSDQTSQFAALRELQRSGREALSVGDHLDFEGGREGGASPESEQGEGGCKSNSAEQCGPGLSYGSPARE